jgi:hypothetical protein
MQLAVYGAVLAIALGSVLLGLDWLSAPMSPMVDTEAGLRAVAPPPIAAAPPSMAPKASIGAPIVPPGLVAPATPNVPPSPDVAVQVAPQEPIVRREPQVSCNVDACIAAYRSFRESDCTYQPSNGPRRLCTK